MSLYVAYNEKRYVFDAQLTLLDRAIAKGSSVYSVCPSVTLVIYAYAVQAIEINFTPYDIAFFRPNFTFLV